MGEGVIAVYAGLHGLAQGLDQVLQAAELLRNETGLRIVFVGDGPLKHELVQQAQRSELQNVRFLASKPHAEIPDLLASADFCIVPLGLTLPGAVPSKLYEAMSAGRPVLLMVCGEAAEIVQANNCGLVVNPGDVQGLADAILILKRDAALRLKLGNNGRQAVEKYYDRRRIVENFADYLIRSSE